MRLLVLLPLVLSACVSDGATMSIQQGRWANYRDYVAGAWEMVLADQPAPQPVKDAFANCVADRTEKFMTPEERGALDNYARGGQGLTVGDAKSIDAAIRNRAGIGAGYTNANIGLLSDTCPNDVPSFRQYLKL